VATTTSDSDQPTPRQRATARLGLFAAAAALAAVSSFAASAPAHASQGDRLCWAGDTGAADLRALGGGACDAPDGEPTGRYGPSQELLGQNSTTSLPLDQILGGLRTSDLLGGLGGPLGGGGGGGGLPLRGLGGGGGGLGLPGLGG
jgi:hypothetical protein